MTRTTLPALLLVTACASAPKVVDPGPSQREVLREDQALLVIQEALVHEGTAAERGFPITVGEQNQLLVDLRLLETVEPAGTRDANAAFAIEWMSDRDREIHAAVLPAGTPDGPLRIITGRGGERTAQVLVLDASAYDYELNPQLVQRGAPGIGDAEARVRRDVMEFLEYARSQE